jgi:hypothetical protein
MKIHVELDGIRMIATLDDNATSRDFVSLLPLTLTLDDYNGTEKISDLPKKLSTRGVPEGMTPVAGDIGYYAPWGNLAIFYKDFSYSRGLMLGRVLVIGTFRRVKAFEDCPPAAVPPPNSAACQALDRATAPNQ